MSEPAIDVRGLVKTFGGRRVVDEFSIRVETGAIYGFLGPNGSGKTTTMRLLCGLLTPDAGEGTCLGLNILTQTDAIKRQIGYMTQKFSLYEDLTIEENLLFVARMYGVPDRKKVVGDALEQLNLTNRKRQLAGTLSGGWKQRLALAACLLHKPRLLLLDEPTAGVDPKARRDFWQEIHQLAADGLTVLVSTHYMDEAERCHRLVYMAYGKRVTEGTAKEVVQNSGLATWSITGPGLAILGRELEGVPGVEMVVPFGTTLHVSGHDPVALDQALSRLKGREGLAWNRIEPGLEDVFIGLMSRSKDNFAE